jgi:ubiquitin-conjugating enzyme E2 Q
MPRKAFLADLKDAKSTNIPNIAAVEAGTNSGTFSFSYLSHHLPESSVIIQGEVPEVSDYPTNHDCFLFINPDQNPPASIPAALGRISSEVKGKTLLETLTKVATSLNNELDPTAAIEISDSDEGYEGGDFEFDEEEEDDEAFSGEPCEAAKATYDSRATPKKTSGEAIAAKKIRSDLRAAQRAGFRVGVLGDLTGTGIVCTSIRVTKLGISEEAMKAWGLRRKQYLILMIRFMDGYQTVDQVQNESSLSGGTQIRAALCERYKPTFDDATNLFTHVAFKDASVQNQRQKAAQTDKEASIPEVSLEPLFIGGPINDLFRERFAGILKYRRACGYSWSGAETFYNDIQGKNMSSSQAFQPQYQVGEDLKGRTLPDIVVADAIGDPIGGTDLSLPLIAMQFLLRHFVRCTEFCLVCHCKVDATFEALKPYVCPKPLCLYQYMALGFGPSISWEIITQPYVVDVLVSFCYVSARNARLKDFPTGIGMKVPMLPQLAIATAISDPYAYGKLRPADPVQPTVELKYEKSFSAQLDRANSELLIEGCKTCPVRGGDWVVVQSPSLDGLIHYRIVDHALFPTVKLDGEGVFTPNHKPQTQISSNSALNAQPTDQKHGFIGVNVFIYDKSFDDLPVPQQQRYVTLLLDTLPPILKLREYLLASHQGPEPQLRTRRHDLSDSALNLLRWIIASNRSCIMQVDKLHEKHADPIPLKMFSVMGGSEDRVSGSKYSYFLTSYSNSPLFE